MSKALAPGGTFEVELDLEPVAGLERLEAVAEHWGASWRQEGIGGGYLALPVRAGVRRGLVEGPVSIKAAVGGGSQLRFDVVERFYRVQYSVFFLLLAGGMGGVMTVAAPFAPRLLPLLPVSIIVAVAAWLLIVSRLHNSGPEEFLAVVAAPEPADTKPGTSDGG